MLAIGNPFGLDQTVTSGIVSAVARIGRRDQRFELLHPDRRRHQSRQFRRRPGRPRRRLIGINTAIYSQTGGSVGIGFATPSNIVARMVATGEAGGRLVRPWLGVSDAARDAPTSPQGIGLARPAGLIVQRGLSRWPRRARRACRRNDVIVALNDQPIDDEAGLRFRLATLAVDANVVR